MDHLCIMFLSSLGFNFSFPQVALQFWMIEEVQWQPAQTATLWIDWRAIIDKPLYGFCRTVTDSGTSTGKYLILSALLLSLLDHASISTSTFWESSPLSRHRSVHVVNHDGWLSFVSPRWRRRIKGTIQSNMWIARSTGSLWVWLWVRSITMPLAVGTFLANACMPLLDCIDASF